MVAGPVIYAGIERRIRTQHIAATASAVDRQQHVPEHTKAARVLERLLHHQQIVLSAEIDLSEFHHPDHHRRRHRRRRLHRPHHHRLVRFQSPCHRQ